MPDTLKKCAICSHVFSGSDLQCPKCGGGVFESKRSQPPDSEENKQNSLLNKKINPRFAELSMIVLNEDLNKMEEAFKAKLFDVIHIEGVQNVRAWLEAIPKLLGVSPKITSEKKQLLQEMCYKIRETLGRNVSEEQVKKIINRTLAAGKTADILTTFRYQTRIDATAVGGPPDEMITITYTFDPKLQSGTGQHGDYPNCGSYGPLSGTIEAQNGGSARFDSGKNSGITVFFNAGDNPSDRYEVFGGYDSGYSGKLFGLDVQSFRFDLMDSSAKMFSGKKLPLSTEFAAHAEENYFYIHLILRDVEQSYIDYSDFTVHSNIEQLRNINSDFTLEKL